MISEKRLNELDVLKALAIILVVLGHSGFPFTRFLYLFHVAVFIITSGFFYKESASDSIENIRCYIVNKIKQLWLPYFIWNTVFVLLNNVFLQLNIYTNNNEVTQFISSPQTTIHSYMSLPEIVISILKGAYFKGGTQIGGAMWFLAILFLLSVAYVISDFLIKRILKTDVIIMQGIVSVALLLLGYFLGLKAVSLFGMAKVCSLYCLFYMGILLKRYKSTYYDKNTSVMIGIVFLSLALLLVLYQISGTVSLVDNSYGNPLFLVVASLAGWFLLFGLSKIICIAGISAIFKYVGKNTLSILILHFLAFKLVAWIVVMAYDLPLFCMAAFPNLYGNRGLWWALYTIAGVLIPLACNYLYISIKNAFTVKE